MLDYIFGFNARLGRMAYIGACFALGLMMGVLFAVVIMIEHHAGPGRFSMFYANIKTWSWPMLILLAAMLYGSLALQSMRIRDIGWDPVCVISAWMAAIFIDSSVAMLFPEYSMPRAQLPGTLAGGLVNLAGGAVLLFWPSGSQQTSMQPVMRSTERSAHTAFRTYN
jgi:uncharacterized membrane protein YhaH (DUF805 family)